MREYNVESIEAKYRADLEELNQYAVIVPLALTADAVTAPPSEG